MPASHGLDEYLEAVYILESENISVIGARVADLLGVRAPSVTEAVHKLEKRGLAALDEHHVISLTPQGWERAESLIRRHRIAERWLTDVIGLDWAQADEEAHKLEHALSMEVADRISKMMEDPKTCPHGNPIPGNWERPSYYGLTLDALLPGEEAIMERVLEHAEVDLTLLRYLWHHGLLPGARMTMIETVEGADIVTVLRDGHEVSLGIRAASKIQVRPVDK
ncbi:MAG: metal-dependent transcriptional regulator [Dehalococcoidia bacterium]|nr:metal-dependent transcriptional regulator [Dehalococcoidia bacterium]